MIPVVVPDASVLLKWALDTTDEEDRQRALQLREDWLADRCRIVVPSLWVYEVGTVLGRQEAQLAPRLLAILVEYRFEEIEGPALSQRALDLVTRLKKVTFYDAAYHAVALLRDGTFVTADDAYVRRARRVGHVVRLREWDLSRR